MLTLAFDFVINGFGFDTILAIGRIIGGIGRVVVPNPYYSGL